MEERDLHTLPPDLPVPVDDGQTEHLPGLELPSLVLDSSQGPVDISTFGVIYVYARTGKPGEPSLPGWDAVPGARGCTPHSCGFRDHEAELRALGYTVAGVSTQPLEDQIEFAERNHIPYPVIADPAFQLRNALGLPVFEIGGETLYKRLALVARDRRIVKVFYPVFPPDKNAEEVLAWISSA